MTTKDHQARKEASPPEAISEWGWRYHHIGIPTREKRPGERYIPHLKMYVTGFDSSPYGIEWIRFEKDTTIDRLIQTVPHVAFEVDDLESALVGKELIGEPSSPSKGVAN